jgi:hypothetical protein
MRTTLALTVACALSTGAVAQSRTTTLDMTCAQARALVVAQGAIVLRTGPYTYDRYVSNASYCAVQETVRPQWVRTADVPQCLVGGVCRLVDID